MTDLDRLPYRNDDALNYLVRVWLPTLPQTLPETAAALKDGSFFDRDIKPVGWWGSFTDAGGYANMNRELVWRLHNHGYLPHIDVHGTRKQIGKDAQELLSRYETLVPKAKNFPYVYAFTPKPQRKRRGKRVLFTMMETSTLHPDFAEYCNIYADEVWTPSGSNRDLFQEYGVKTPIKVIPLGIDGKLYFETPRRGFPFHECKGIFGVSPQHAVAPIRFLTVINWNPRKGYDALIEAFVNAFRQDDPVALVIAAAVPEEIVSTMLYPHLPRRNDLPQVMLYNRVIPIEAMPSIYDCVHCYVHLSRGEGFSLTQIEAAARGVPVISCCHSGMTEYLREDNSYPIYCTETAPCDPELSKVSVFYEKQKMWKVGPDQSARASELMRHVVANYAEARTKAEVLRKEVREKYTWDLAAERVAEALKD